MQTELTRALTFLHKEFDARMYWWELVEATRKLLLIGIFILPPFRPGTVFQLIVAMMTSLVFLFLQMLAQPFKEIADDFLAMATSTALILLFFGSIVLKLSILVEFPAVEQRLSPALKWEYT